ncbi:hypothetical protein AYO45_02750 [Gammaproteobacteria bacterium SCGC AG-212-F23]|nr:hypothetical protein AYO45_02750 [Gammaproteobacteria bacterium SCGC AG-212-F23]
MQIFLVGGAVRDELLKYGHHEKDWVVVGSTPEEMLQKGFRQVGKDFPVFLHPKTHEEYALARKERKTGKGYTAFDFDASTTVTLEDDLKRRDFTINAMAKTAEGVLIDPYDGKNDLDNKILRHVSPAFAEDPVRILRAARFMARYAHLGFHIAPETIALMKTMVANGEVNALVPERVWKECERAFSEKNPECFFSVLNDCGALSVLFPEMQFSEKNLAKISVAVTDALVRFAAFFHHISQDNFLKLNTRYRIPAEYTELTLLVITQLLSYQKASQLSAEDIFQLLSSLDAFRREKRFENFLQACEAVSPLSQSSWLRKCFMAAKKIDAHSLVEMKLQGKALGEKIREQRILAIAELKKS